MKSKKALSRALRIIGWTATALSILMVFGFSSETAAESSARSRGLSIIIAELWHPDLYSLDEAVRASVIYVCQFGVRKLAHYLEYGLIGTLSALTVQTYGIDQKIKILIPSALGLAVAILDELSQNLSAGRGPRFTDVHLDFAGALTAAAGISLIFTLISYFRSKKRKAAEAHQ